MGNTFSLCGREPWKGLLVSLNNPHRGSVDLLLVLREEESRLEEEGFDPDTRSSVPPPYRFTGDGLGMLAGLMTSGLVEIDRRFSGSSLHGGGGTVIHCPTY